MNIITIEFVFMPYDILSFEEEFRNRKELSKLRGQTFI